MTEVERIDQDIAAKDKAERRNKFWMYLGLSAIAVACILAIVVFILRDHYRGKTIDDLADALDISREQLEYCMNQFDPDPEDCDKSVVPDADSVINNQQDKSPVEIVEGERGLTGQRGPRGFSCIEQMGIQFCRGDEGFDGRPGAEGKQGRVGSTGATGASCVAELGLEACRGPKGDSVKGDRGEQGPVGPAGPAGLVTAGTWGCPDGQYMVRITSDGSGGLAVECAAIVGPGNGNGEPQNP